MRRTVQLCGYLLAAKKEYQIRVNNHPQVSPVYKPYTKGICTSAFVRYIAQKEGKLKKAEFERIGSEIRDRVPQFIVIENSVGIQLSNDNNQVILGGEILNFSENGYSLVEGRFMKYLYRFKFWSEKWNSPINLLIVLGLGATIGAIVQYFLIPLLKEYF